MKRNSLGWAIVDVALLIILLNMLAGCVRYVEKEAPTPYVVVGEAPWSPCRDDGYCTIAITTCSEANSPVVLIRKDFNTPDRRALLVTHESTHVQQMKRDCKAVLQSYQDTKEVKVRMESEAYCAEAREKAKHSTSPAEVANWYIGIIRALYEADALTCEMVRRMATKPP